MRSPSITGTYMPTPYKSDIEETQVENPQIKFFFKKDSETYASCDSSLKTKTKDFPPAVDIKTLPESDVEDPNSTAGSPSFSCLENVKSPRIFCNKSGMNNRNVCKNNYVRVKKCFVCGSKLHLIKDCDFYNCVDSVPCKSKAASVPAGSRNSSASVTAGGSAPAASRNRPAVNSAGRPNPTGRVGQAAHLATAQSNPAGWSKRPAPVSAGRPVSAGWLNPALPELYECPVSYDMKGRRMGGTVCVSPQRLLLENKDTIFGDPRVMGDLVQYNGYRSGMALSNWMVAGGRPPPPPALWEGLAMVVYQKGAIRTSKLDFENVYYVEELQHFNLFSVSQICDNKNKVLFTDTDCLVLTEEFQLPDESQVVLRIPRERDLYTFSISELQPEQNVTYLVAKASLDEWHKRMTHVNFKTINKLAKEGLVDGLPLKVFTKTHLCCLHPKESNIRILTMAFSAVSTYYLNICKLMHMDLFGPTLYMVYSTEVNPLVGKADAVILFSYAPNSKGISRVIFSQNKKGRGNPDLRFLEDKPKCTQETNINAGTQDHDSDSEVLHQEMVLVLWNAMQIMQKSLLSFKDNEYEAKDAVHDNGFMFLTSKSRNTSQAEAEIFKNQGVSVNDSGSCLVLILAGGVLLTKLSIAKALRIDWVAACKKRERCNSSSTRKNGNLFPLLMAKCNRDGKWILKNKRGCQRNVVGINKARLVHRDTDKRRVLIMMSIAPVARIEAIDCFLGLLLILWAFWYISVMDVKTSLFSMEKLWKKWWMASSGAEVNFMQCKKRGYVATSLRQSPRYVSAAGAAGVKGWNSAGGPMIMMVVSFLLICFVSAGWLVDMDFADGSRVHVLKSFLCLPLSSSVLARKLLGRESDDFPWDKPVRTFSVLESESEDDMENYIPPPSQWLAFKDWLTVPPSYCRDVVVAGNIIQTVQDGLRQAYKCIASAPMVADKCRLLRACFDLLLMCGGAGLDLYNQINSARSGVGRETFR
ncbi:putative ribonuclease H-like domain-containing protein [Tanacetum coccineum]